MGPLLFRNTLQVERAACLPCPLAAVLIVVDFSEDGATNAWSSTVP